MIGIKLNGIDIYHFNVSFLFLVSFFLCIMDCTVLESPTHFFEMVHISSPYARHHLSLWLILQYLHILLADVLAGVAGFVSLLALVFLLYCLKVPQFPQAVDN